MGANPTDADGPALAAVLEIHPTLERDLLIPLSRSTSSHGDSMGYDQSLPIL